MDLTSTELQAKLENFRTAVLIARGRAELCRAEMELDEEHLMATLREVMDASGRSAPIGTSRSIFEAVRSHHWVVREVDRQKGNYFGVVVAVDSIGCFIQFRSNEVVELEFNTLAAGQRHPSMGDSVRMLFKGGRLRIAVTPRRQQSSQAY
jgi:hypothetical protein